MGKLTISLLAIMLLAISLAACSSATTTAPAPAPAPTITSAAPTTAAPKTTTASPAPAAVKPIQWRIQSYFASAGNDPAPLALVSFVNRVKQRSGGRLDMHIYWEGELGVKPADYLKAVRGGAIDIAVTYDGYHSGDIEAASISNYVWVGATFNDCQRLIDQVLYKSVDKTLKEKFNSSLIWMETTPTVNTFLKKPLDNYFGMKGLKIRVYSAETADYFSALGGVGVFIPWGEVYPSLEKGVVDGWYSTVTHLEPRKLYEQTTYWVNDYLTHGYYLWIVNQDSLAALPQDLQTIVKEEAKGVTEQFRKDRESLIAAGWRVAKEKNMTEIKLPEGSAEKIRGIVKNQLMPQWTGKLSAEGKATLAEALKVMGW